MLYLINKWLRFNASVILCYLKLYDHSSVVMFHIISMFPVTLQKLILPLKAIIVKAKNHLIYCN